MIDTVAGAEASAMIYSIAETAKANNLKPYNYFKYLLEEIPRHMDEHGVDFSEEIYLRDITLCPKVYSTPNALNTASSALEYGII